MNNKEHKTSKDWTTVTSLYLGIASIFLWEFSIVPILAVIFGVIGLLSGGKNEWKAWSGVVLGVVFLVVRMSVNHVDNRVVDTTSNSNIRQTYAVPQTQTAPESTTAIPAYAPLAPVYKNGSYYAFFLQNKDMAFRTAQVSARYTDAGVGSLIHPENYVSFYINIPGNHVWVNCAPSNYYVAVPESLSKNELKIDPVMGIGMELIEQQQNQVSFVCVPK